MEEAVSLSPGQVLARVESELQALWSSPPAPGETPKARACTRNLVVVAGTPEVATRWLPTVDDVIQTIPARAIVVGLDPDGPDALEATTTAVCTPGVSGGPSVCSERVTLEARGAACTRVASCVETLCSSDVPTTLVWLGRVHADDLLFAPLARSADRVVLDSAQGSLGDLTHLVRWANGRPAGLRPGVCDIAWTRLAPWQELCARMFDEMRLHELATRVTRVRIVQASAAGDALGSEGALLLGWLATRLAWKATSLAGKLRLARPDEGTVLVQLVSECTAKLSTGTLFAVEIAANAGPIGLLGQVRREHGESDAATWRLEVTTAGETKRIEQRVRLRASEPAPLLERTLRRPPHDEALVESVAWADGLLDEEIACG
jgi:glucose-6-phosphate dehydrogenase assembly protein OpcA